MRVLYGDNSGLPAELRSPQEKLPGLRLAVESGRRSLTHNTKSAFLANLIHQTSTSQRGSIGTAYLLRYTVKTAKRMAKVARNNAAAGIQGR